MNTIEFSQSTTSISKALVSLRAKLKPLLKRDTNPHFGSRYAGLDLVLESVDDALAEAEIAPIQGVATMDDGSIAVETLLLHGPSAEWVKTGIALKPTKNDPQGVGSCITYGRRYTLQAILAIAAEDDDGNAASQPYSHPARDYKLKAELIPTVFPAASENREAGEWVEGSFGPVNQDKSGQPCWFSNIAGQSVWTRDVKMADSMRDTHGEVVKAHIRKKTPESKSAQLLSFMPL